MVQSGRTILVQVPTVWNLADIGTKPLSAERMRVLLHELCICSDEGATVVGQAEHEEQSAKHGGNKDMLVLAKKVSPGPPLDGP